jgi:hypothetical protein
MLHQVALETKGTKTTISIDEHDISGSARSVNFSARAGRQPSLVVDLAGDFYFGGQARVDLTEKTSEALIAMGWTPPEMQRGWTRKALHHALEEMDRWERKQYDDPDTECENSEKRYNEARASVFMSAIKKSSAIWPVKEDKD